MVFAAVLAACQTVAADASNIFVPVSDTELAGEHIDRAGISRVLSVVRVNERTLLSSARLTLNVAPHTSFVAQRRKLDLRSETDFTWYGDIPSVHGDAILVVSNGHVTGTITAGAHVYSVRPLDRAGMHVISLLDYRRLPPEHPTRRE